MKYGGRNIKTKQLGYCKKRNNHVIIGPILYILYSAVLAGATLIPHFL